METKQTWQETIVKKYFVYKLGGKFPDHVGAEKELLQDIENLLTAQRQELVEEVMAHIDTLHPESHSREEFDGIIYILHFLQALLQEPN